MGRHYPSSMAAMRGIKAEGGWAVVTTEQCDIHYSGNHLRELRLWDSKDVGYLAKATTLIHEHGGLAAIELAHNGSYVGNLESRAIPLAPSLAPVRGVYPITARAMDKEDIAAVRRWHRTAAINARSAGFDIVYVYAGHDMTLPAHFLSRRKNRRTDEYGGSMENRVRFLRELVEDARDAVGDTCAIAVRFSVDELLGPHGITSDDEGRAVIELLAELPDLWDVNIGDFDNDGQTSRFAAEGYQERYVKFVKGITSKPVVGVGRFTSPDVMAAMIRSGTLDLIGAARPSIADPFLPRKVEEGRIADIRECIGCNICVAGDRAGVPMSCTQNPTMGEEWRRGWHPEYIPPRSTDDTVLIVGGGPSGLEAARALGQRGYEVMLVERRRDLGGRVTRESELPGLGAWRRVRDWRLGQLDRMGNVQLVRGDEMTASAIMESGFSLIGLATGARWRGDGVGRARGEAIPGLTSLPVFTPDDVMDGRLPAGRVVIFDDEHYYMGSVIAELLIARGREVTYVTPNALVAAYTQFTAEQGRIQRRMLESCGAVHTSRVVARVAPGEVVTACSYTGREASVPADALVLVTGAIPEDNLWRALAGRGAGALGSAGIQRVVRLGDCLAPGTIAAAVYSGHLFGRTLDTGLSDTVPYRRENVQPDWAQPLPLV